MNFVTQEQADELKRKRQADWERVRKPDDPLEPPEEVYDARPLYERLKEQKDKAQEQYEEQFKFKNMIYKGLDDEEANFLDLMDKQRTSHRRELYNRETEELSSYKNAVSNLIDETERNQELLSPTLTVPSVQHTKPSNKSQSNILAGSIITKRKRKSTSTSDDTDTSGVEETNNKKTKSSDEKDPVTSDTCTPSSVTAGNSVLGSLAANYSSSESEED